MNKGSRCESGAAPATVTEDESEHDHWVQTTWEGLAGGRSRSQETYCRSSQRVSSAGHRSQRRSAIDGISSLPLGACSLSLPKLATAFLLRSVVDQARARKGAPPRRPK